MNDGRVETAVLVDFRGAGGEEGADVQVGVVMGAFIDGVVNVRCCAGRV